MRKCTLLLILLYPLFAVISSPLALHAENFPPPLPNTGAAIVVDAQTGAILYEKNAHAAKYPASTVKIMTALLALSHYEMHLYEPVYFSHEAVFGIPRHSSHIAMDVGETLSMADALYGLMLPSANEVSLALAEHIAGDTADFVGMMNRRAAAMGATDTYFSNPSGLHSPAQVATAYDLALITRHALQIPGFVDIISTRSHHIPPTERQPQPRPLHNTHRMMFPGTAAYDPRVLGGKTGFTDQARHTAVTLAEADDRRLVVVVLDSTALYADTRALLDYAFAVPYTRHRLFDGQDVAFTLPVYAPGRTQETLGNLPLTALENVYATLPEGVAPGELEKRILPAPTLVAPVGLGDHAGRVRYYLRGNFLGEASLQAAADFPLPLSTERGGGTTLHGAVNAATADTPVITMAQLAENYTASVLLPLVFLMLTLLILAAWLLPKKK